MRRLIFHQNASISCDIPYGLQGQIPCSLMFEFPEGIELHENATIRAPSVRLFSDGPVYVGPGASVSADGLGSGGEGYTSTNQHVGGWHGGIGGDCDGVGGGDYLSDDVDMGDGTDPLPFVPRDCSGYDGCVPAHYFGPSDEGFSHVFGAGVQFSQTRNTSSHVTRTCFGGGAILVRTQSFIQLEGSISANGQAPCRNDEATTAANSERCPICPRGPTGDLMDACAGGSGAAGGTVLLLASGEPFAINGSGTVNASGASADHYCQDIVDVPWGGGGGAGGRIKLPRHVGGAIMAWAPGGEGASPAGTMCTLGGAGTVFYYTEGGAGESTDASEHHEGKGGGANEAALDMAGGNRAGGSMSLMVVQHTPRDQNIETAPTYIRRTGQPSVEIADLHLSNGALLYTPNQGSANGLLTVPVSVTMDSNSYLSVKDLVAGSLSVLGSSSIFSPAQHSATRLNVSSIFVSPQSDISDLTDLFVTSYATIEVWARAKRAPHAHTCCCSHPLHHPRSFSRRVRSGRGMRCACSSATPLPSRPSALCAPASSR